MGKNTKIVLIGFLVLAGAGLGTFTGYKIYRSIRTKSGDSAKANRFIVIERTDS